MSNLNNTEILGLVAAFLTTVSFLPQVYQTWKTKDVSGLSLPMFSIYFSGIVIWLVYGFLLNSPALIFSNTVTALSSFLLLFFKLKYGKRKYK
ncbi:SemiSWEET family sugar transporter [uncultured Psychroserpens sp.]|uniref:SemiSWEET family sugar transporter n=1 Tax=uncultured Psychroserpens sp. TaxID=255436 RepID=UPI002625939E|nr:SemiSWEET transporter [uncultured Psychroserpens sp.]